MYDRSAWTPLSFHHIQHLYSGGMFSVFMVRTTPWSPWKALEFNIWFQGRLKSPWKEEIYVKVLENNGNSLNFLGVGNNKGYIKNWAHILNLQNDFAKNFCSTCTFACRAKSDLRTLYSGISFSMWSDGRHRATPSSVCCVRLRGFVSTFALLNIGTQSVQELFFWW